MENPLTLEERVKVTKLIGHDLASHLLRIANVASKELKLNPKKVSYEHQHCYNVLNSITILSGYTDNCYFERTNPESINFMLKLLSSMFEDRVSYSSNIFRRSFKTQKELIYTYLYNSTKNALKHGYSKDGKIKINVSHFTGEIPDPVYVSEESSCNGSFIVFSVNDNGPGFPKDKPLKEWLEFGNSSRDGAGFGLYYATLVSKFLRSPLVINSEKGNTNISLYHTINLE